MRKMAVLAGLLAVGLRDLGRCGVKGLQDTSQECQRPEGLRGGALGRNGLRREGLLRLQGPASPNRLLNYKPSPPQLIPPPLYLNMMSGSTPAFPAFAPHMPTSTGMALPPLPALVGPRGSGGGVSTAGPIRPRMAPTQVASGGVRTAPGAAQWAHPCFICPGSPMGVTHLYQHLLSHSKEDLALILINKAHNYQRHLAALGMHQGGIPMLSANHQYLNHQRYGPPAPHPGWNNMQNHWSPWGWGQHPQMPWGPRPFAPPNQNPSHPESHSSHTPKAKEVWTHDPKDEGFWRSVAQAVVGSDNRAPANVPRPVGSSGSSNDVVMIKRGSYQLPNSSAIPMGAFIHAPDGNVLKVYPNSGTTSVCGRHASAQTDLTIPSEKKCVLIPEMDCPIYLTREKRPTGCSKDEEQFKSTPMEQEVNESSTDSDPEPATPMEEVKEPIKISVPEISKSIKVVMDNNNSEKRVTNKPLKTIGNGISILKHPVSQAKILHHGDCTVTVKTIKLDPTLSPMTKLPSD
eukprot:maker-scaffold324_size206069-snap-gene-1.29 protein:Tk12291 transcript:maker-scaffold324_size206069-snap-gene-1.29-mRNA-1 annotation:"hypothetical protein JCM21714_1749"